MPDTATLERALKNLQRAHPSLDALQALVLLALDDQGKDGLSSALLSRRLGIEHALIRRALAELEVQGWVHLTAGGGASPALRVTLARSLPGAAPYT
ncbi:MarR family transcriptional regulator [Vreelandella malpeensis]|uniref:MarR family transcriptional regulator n=1 Tax=Vreelandella malpeensis TaxID=1172368 RepID=A0ABS8DSJ0_9GAMM|nr:MarR family transcriptional regulator [Halomonas malpeensis]MCB8889293.1 MarR family transcriptional regulator [Halomonas malpeensis]